MPSLNWNLTQEQARALLAEQPDRAAHSVVRELVENMARELCAPGAGDAFALGCYAAALGDALREQGYQEALKDLESQTVGEP